MRDVATATISGNLTRDVEVRELPSGAIVARLRVATKTRWRQAGEWIDRRNYFNVEVHGAQASACAQHLARGSCVVVDAELEWREWTDPQGRRREAVTVKARQVLFEGVRPAAIARLDGSDGASEVTDALAMTAESSPEPDGVVSPDDLPF